METEPNPPRKSSEFLLVIWAGSATVAAIVSTAVALTLFVSSRKQAAEHAQPLAMASSGPFADIPESDIPGRYSWSKGKSENNLLTLLPDHSFTYNSEKLPIYRWELMPE